MKFTVDINVNIPGLLPLLSHFFNHFKESIMGALEDLQASTTALVAKVEEANAKTDNLILVANTTKDALAALVAQGSGITAAQVQGIIDQQTAAINSLTAQEAETDAAAAAVAP